MSQCCGSGSIESLMDKFKIVNKTYNIKQHPHNTTTLNTSLSNNTVLTNSGYVKYIIKQ